MHPLAGFLAADAFAEGVDLSAHLMARDVRIGESRKTTFDREGVRVTDTARFDANTDLPGRGCCHCPFHEFELAGLADLDGPVGFSVQEDFLRSLRLRPRSQSVRVRSSWKPIPASASSHPHLRRRLEIA